MSSQVGGWRPIHDEPTNRAEKAEVLLSLHRGGDLLRPAEHLGPASARILEAKGYPAVATASAAVSASLGYQDGERIDRSTLIELLAADRAERGCPGHRRHRDRLRRIGVRPGTDGPAGDRIRRRRGQHRGQPGQGRRPAACRGAVPEDRDASGRSRIARGVHLVINARVDSFVSPAITDGQRAMEEAVMRARRVRRGRAPTASIPSAREMRPTVRLLRGRIASPINILASPTAAPLAVPA